MQKKLVIEKPNLATVNEEDYYSPKTSENSDKSPLLSYKLDKYHQFYHPISTNSLIKLQSADTGEVSPDIIPENLAKTSEKVDLFKEDFDDFASFHIKEAEALSPSPQLKGKFLENSTKHRMKVSKSFCFGLIKLQVSKELRNWSVFSRNFSVIATTFHSPKHFEVKDTGESSTILLNCLKKFKKFPVCQDLSINIETFAEFGEIATSVICSAFSLKKQEKVKDLRLVSFPGEQNLWHGPAFLFNSVMGFNKPEVFEAIPRRLELWHRFRGCFEQGARQNELLRLLSALNAGYKGQKLEILHVIFASYQRFGDKLAPVLRETLALFLAELQEFKLFLSSEFLTDEGFCEIFADFKEIAPKKLKSFHVFLDVRTNPRVSSKTVVNLCKTLLGVAENSVVEYLSLGFLSNSLKESELLCVGEALRLISKSLRSLVLIFFGNISDEGIVKIAENFVEAPNLKRICLGFMSSSLKNPEKSLGFLAERLEKKKKSGSLSVFHVYYNNRAGTRNEELEEKLRKRLGGEEIDLETYLFS